MNNLIKFTISERRHINFFVMSNSNISLSDVGNLLRKSIAEFN